MNIVLTGGHTGIGLELTKLLLPEGHKLGLILRSEKRKNETAGALGNAETVDFFYADLSKQADIKRVAAEITAAWGHLDGLFNNAGVLLDQAYYSEQGNEMHYEVNTLAPYMLTTHLKPLLDKAERPFVVNTVTGGMHNQKALDIEAFKKPEKFTKLFGSYFQSKLALVMLMDELAEQWPNMRIVNVDPGPNKTNMTEGDGMPFWLRPLRNLFFNKPTKGAKLLYDGAFRAQFQDQSGVYLTGNKVRPMALKLDAVDLDKLRSGLTTKSI